MEDPSSYSILEASSDLVMSDQDSEGSQAGPSRPRPENNGRTHHSTSGSGFGSSHTPNQRQRITDDPISIQTSSTDARRPSPLLYPPVSSSGSDSDYSSHSPIPTPSPLSAGSNTSTGSNGSKSKLKRRPLPLVLGPKAREVGVDEERSAQLEANGLNSATSAVAIQTHTQDDGRSTSTTPHFPSLPSHRGRDDEIQGRGECLFATR